MERPQRRGSYPPFRVIDERTDGVGVASMPGQSGSGATLAGRVFRSHPLRDYPGGRDPLPVGPSTHLRGPSCSSWASSLPIQSM